MWICVLNFCKRWNIYFFDPIKKIGFRKKLFSAYNLITTKKVKHKICTGKALYLPAPACSEGEHSLHKNAFKGTHIQFSRWDFFACNNIKLHNAWTWCSRNFIRNKFAIYRRHAVAISLSQRVTINLNKYAWQALTSVNKIPTI